MAKLNKLYLELEYPDYQTSQTVVAFLQEKGWVIINKNEMAKNKNAFTWVYMEKKVCE